jgi:hypothetical protein
MQFSTECFNLPWKYNCIKNPTLWYYDEFYFDRLCLKPLLHDLPSTSFTTKTISLSNPWYLNSKGIYSASFLTYLANGTFLTNVGNTSSEIDLWGNVNIRINLPKVSLVKGIWWSTYTQDSYNGIITKIGKLQYFYDCQKMNLIWHCWFILLIMENYRAKSLTRSAVLNPGYVYPLGYVRSSQGVHQILKIPQNKFIWVEFFISGGTQGGYNSDLGVRREVHLWFGGAWLPKGWEPLD